MSHSQLAYEEHGDPEVVITLKEQDSLPQPAQGEALIEVEFANINPSDMGIIAGSYGRLPNLPSVAGREGVGTVVEVNDPISEIKVGDRVRIPEGVGAWQSHCVAATTELMPIPINIDPAQAATLFINPTTALMLLESFVTLEKGDWVIQNAGNSSVGTWVIQIARVLGLKTINVVRRESLIDPLKQLGADVVVLEGSDYTKELKTLTHNQRPRLALNSIGGESVSKLIKCLADGGVCVTFGGMVGDPIRFPTRFLIFNDIQLRGFWMDKWIRTHSMDVVQELFHKVFNLVTEHQLNSPIEAIYDLSDFKQALKHYRAPRMGKVLFRMKS